MNDNKRAKWERVRRKGELRFVLLRGVLGVGLICFVLLDAAYRFLSWLSKPVPISPNPLLAFLAEAAFWMALGAFWGHWMWVRNEREYSKSYFEPKETSTLKV
jgi:hypothetical protein